MKTSTLDLENTLRRAQFESAKARFALGEIVTTAYGTGPVIDVLFDHDMNSAVICVDIPSARFDWIVRHRIPA